ncbi:hypothetical protein [Aureliella helgolandensis]|nr:hypothetical protein [Aureliella helgolandensis]
MSHGVEILRGKTEITPAVLRQERRQAGSQQSSTQGNDALLGYCPKLVD